MKIDKNTKDMIISFLIHSAVFVISVIVIVLSVLFILDLIWIYKE